MGELSTDMLIYVSGVICFAATLQGVAGFGFNLLAVPPLILMFPAQIVVPGLILTYPPLGVAQVIQLRKDVDWRLLLVLLGSAVVALPLGAWILRETDTEIMQRAIGIVLILLAIVLQVRPGEPIARERAATVGAGILAGALASSTAMSGPPLVILGLKQRWPTKRFRATLIAYFLSISFLCFPFYWELNLLNQNSVQFAVAGLPGLFLGFFTGTWLRNRVHGAGFRWLAVAIVFLGGAAAAIF